MLLTTGMLFQSPRSGKFVSNCRMTKRLERGAKVFQSPRSGKFVSDPDQILRLNAYSSFDFLEFQSPRSGKFVSNIKIFLKEKQ